MISRGDGAACRQADTYARIEQAPSIKASADGRDADFSAYDASKLHVASLE